MNNKRAPKNKLLTLLEYQESVDKTDEKKRTIISLLGLVGEIGDLHSIFKKGLIQSRNPSFGSEIAEELGDILWYVASLASRMGLSLEDVARQNIVKARQFFDEGGRTKFDHDFPKDERLPREFSVVFEEKEVGKEVQVKARINDVYVGDALDDNAYSEDGYRFHDVFHLAYAAVLGWSPVTRALLRRKRKSDRDIDRIEDGARAIFLEEAIAVFVFNQAEERGSYKEKNSIDVGMLKTVKRLTANLEVRSCTAKQWRDAIYQGYDMFELLKKHHGGVVHVNLNTQTVRFERLKKNKKSRVK